MIREVLHVCKSFSRSFSALCGIAPTSNNILEVRVYLDVNDAEWLYRIIGNVNYIPFR